MGDTLRNEYILVTIMTMAQVPPLATPMVVVSRSGPRHGEVSSRGESKSAAPSHNGVNFENAAPPPGVNLENFAEVKFRDILLTGKGHRDRRLNRDSPGQTRTYGRSNLNQTPKLNLNLTSGHS